MLSFEAPIPVFRSFDEQKTKEFYLDFLGFELVFEHRFAMDTPLFMGVRRGNCVIYLSEHFGDASPGSSARIQVSDVHAYCRDLNAKQYRHARPGVQEQPWGDDMTVNDPSGNKLIFSSVGADG